MLRMCKLIAMSAFALTVAVLTSGCYTIVGYPPEAEESIIEEGTAPGQVYRDYDYYYDSPYSYYGGYYDPYYGFWYPYSHYYYRDYPRRWYYNDYYYWGYGDRYVPEEKPGTRRREASRLQRAPGPRIRRGSRLEKDEEKKPPSRQIRSERRTSNEMRRSARRRSRDSASSSKERSGKRKSQDEEE